MQFRRCVSDGCIFVKESPHGLVIIALYIDDMLIGAASVEEIKFVKQSLARHFNIKDIGPAQFVLGMELQYDRTRGWMSINQSQLIFRLVEKLNQENARDTNVPLLVGEDLSSSAAQGPEAKMEARPYQSLVGSLLYVATTTRPDITHVVAKLSRYLDRATPVHWKAAVRVLRYLKTTSSIGINYKADADGPRSARLQRL